MSQSLPQHPIIPIPVTNDDPISLSEKEPALKSSWLFSGHFYRANAITKLFLGSFIFPISLLVLIKHSLLAKVGQGFFAFL